MGKDREGKFHPRKGRPSGSGMPESSGIKPINSSAIDEHFEIADKYTIGEEEPAPNVNVRHRNRNADKREERTADKTDQRKAMVKDRILTSPRPSGVTTEELPAVLSKDKLNELVNFTADHCISVFMPTHPGGAEVNEQMDNIAFKTKLRQIAQELKQDNVGSDYIDSLLKPAHELLHNDPFWRSLSHGLAVFIADGQLKFMRMPVTPKEAVVIKKTFHISPLLPVLTNSDHFYVLVLSKKQAKLYRADAFGMVHVPVPEMPDGVDDVVHFEEKDDQKLFRTDSGLHGHGAAFHGHGAGKPDNKANLGLYFDEVDETLCKDVLRNETSPLLLVGVEYLIPIYKEVAKYKPIWGEAILGNREHEDINTLYQEAKKKMEPYFEERHVRALEAYANNSGTSLTSSLPEQVIPAAYYKRVWHLFVQQDQSIWGTFDEMNNRLIIHPVPKEGDEDLTDKVIVKTILNAGEVHVLPKDRMPAHSPLAALFRY